VLYPHFTNMHEKTVYFHTSFELKDLVSYPYKNSQCCNTLWDRNSRLTDNMCYLTTIQCCRAFTSYCTFWPQVSLSINLYKQCLYMFATHDLTNKHFIYNLISLSLFNLNRECDNPYLMSQPHCLLLALSFIQQMAA